MKYLYGPVKSRRLGLSLGVSLTPYKICSFDCVYCQLGKTTSLSTERKEYLPIGEILNELNNWLENNTPAAKELNYITLSGAGESTLNSKIGQLIAEIKKMAASPIAVITNASLFSDPTVITALEGADLIVPSLDTVNPEVFLKVNRPYPQIKVEDVINGLLNLKKGFRGKIWLEVMLVKGLNDDLRQIKKLKEVIDRINPDKIQLNSPVRTTAEPDIFAVDKSKLKKIQAILGDKCEII
jgi:wyosine [tRNA(Phe)-imidazoG37] synthetase (radical SAM superfamily)